MPLAIDQRMAMRRRGESAMMGDGIDRSVRLVAAAALLTLVARRRARAPPPAPLRAQESGLSPGHDRRRRFWNDLVWSGAILLLLTIVAYAALHGADILGELDELRVIPGSY